MVYSPLVKKACIILFEAHKNDVDKGGYPYVFHPFYLASQMNEETRVCVALLHDVIEDHGDLYSIDSLRKEGFPEEVLDALKLLAHNPEVPYMDYVAAIRTNPVARDVKIADLRHNMDASRNDGKLPPKYETYRKALAYLEAK